MEFRKLAFKDAEEITFGFSKKPMKYGLELEVGNGLVIPEIKYLLKAGFERSLETLMEGYEETTISILERAVELGIESLQFDTEFVEPMTINPSWGESIVRRQKEIMEKYHKEYGIKSALRATIADVRRFKSGLRSGDYFEKMMEAFEKASEAGADLISIESRGGQEVFSYALMRNDIEGIVFSLGILATFDMEFLWNNIVKTVKGKSIPAGDTACATANSAMVLAGGLKRRRIPHVLAAVIRAMAASRSLVAYESGAQGPGKDCGYENVIVKIITGYPMAMEGKTAAMAHSSLVGNIIAATCDLWSNETVEVSDVFGGKTSAVLLEMLGYDTALMNIAIKTGKDKILRDLLVNSDIYKDPQALILAPKNAFRIASSIISSKSKYERTILAALEAIKIIKENLDKLNLPSLEIKFLSFIENSLKSLPNESTLIEKCIKNYSGKIPNFNPSNYEL